MVEWLKALKDLVWRKEKGIFNRIMTPNTPPKWQINGSRTKILQS